MDADFASQQVQEVGGWMSEFFNPGVDGELSFHELVAFEMIEEVGDWGYNPTYREIHDWIRNNPLKCSEIRGTRVVTFV